MKIVMVGVSPERTGGMWSVASNFLNNKNLNSIAKIKYIYTSTNGSKLKRLKCMFNGFTELIKELSKKNTDIVYVHMAEKGSTFRKGFCIFIAKRYKCKTIIQMHAGPIMEWYESCGLITKKIIKKIFNSADKFLVLGNFWKNEIIKIVDKKKVEVLYNGIDIPPKNFYNINNKNILFMGRINEKKGIYDLIDAIALINKKLDKNIKLVICGKDETGYLKKYIKEKELLDRVILKGWIIGDDIVKEYKKALLNILPSYIEALPMNIIESMSYGVPSIATNITTISEILPYNDDLFNPGDKEKLARLILDNINNKENLIKKSQMIYNRVREEFDINIICDNLINICYSLLEDEK